MKWYHGTNKEAWEHIQKEKILFGIDKFDNNALRKTYLAVDIKEAKCYGNVLLEVEYDPTIHPNMNNYIDGCWQVRVYEPIPISKIKLIAKNKKE